MAPLTRENRYSTYYYGQQARQRSVHAYPTDYRHSSGYTYTDVPIQRPTRPIRRKKAKKKVNVFANLLLFVISCLIAYYIIPFSFHRLTKPLFLGANYPEVKVDYYEMMYPTRAYLSNNMDLFLKKRNVLPNVSEKEAVMTELYKTSKMTMLENALNTLISKNPSISPAIFVWDFDSGKYVSINAEKRYSAASIIKIPVLIHLFKAIEYNELSIYDEMVMDNHYKSSGSGNMQYQSTGNKYTIDSLAKYMIEDSDNTATNMLMSRTGSMVAVNRSINEWGLKNTHVQTWLPDLTGTNYTTAEDIATMLYNLDNPSFLNITSREYIVDYMSHVKNDRLIPVGLGKGSTFIHKTGDISTMLGDAGIVYMPNGKKYVISILAERPFNSPVGKTFIQQASKIIYDYMAQELK